jgi:hypothetical protein
MIRIIAWLLCQTMEMRRRAKRKVETWVRKRN